MKKIHGPQGIRVWQGYRNTKYLDNSSSFMNELGELVIPATMQMLEQVGLKSYFPSILPPSNFILPDEIALEMYDSPQSYLTATESTILGKAHKAILNNTFNFSDQNDIPKSTASFPVAFENKIILGQPYYLCDNEINWRDNKTNIYCAKRLPHISPEKMIAHIQDVIPDWLGNNINVNGSILICEKDYVLYWEHSKFWDSGLSLTSLFPMFSSVLSKPVLEGKPLLRSVPPLNTLDYRGLKIESGSSLDVRVIGAPINNVSTTSSSLLAIKYN